MHIPAPAQELHLPLTQKLEASPVIPVTAVAGVAEEAQLLDSRVALQWAQPVFEGAQGQAGRSALAAPLPLLARAAVPGYEPQGADPDALLSGEVHPLMAQGLATWLSRVLARPDEQQSVPTGPQMATPQTPVSKPDLGAATATASASAATALPAKAAPDASPLMPLLKGLYQALAQSDVFAAQRLNEAWMPRRVAGAAQPSEISAPLEEPQPEVNHPRSGVTSSKAFLPKDTEEFHTLARPVAEPTASQLTQWAAAIEPDSDSAQQAARMLTQGQMVWQAELMPGVPFLMVREDAWRNRPGQQGELEKGATLRVEVDLPKLGRLRIVGSQWGDDLALHIAHVGDAKGNWARLALELMQELKDKGVGEVRVEALPVEEPRA